MNPHYSSRKMMMNRYAAMLNHQLNHHWFTIIDHFQLSQVWSATFFKRLFIVNQLFMAWMDFATAQIFRLLWGGLANTKSWPTMVDSGCLAVDDGYFGRHLWLIHGGTAAKFSRRAPNESMKINTRVCLHAVSYTCPNSTTYALWIGMAHRWFSPSWTVELSMVNCRWFLEPMISDHVSLSALSLTLPLVTSKQHSRHNRWPSLTESLRIITNVAWFTPSELLAPSWTH